MLSDYWTLVYFESKFIDAKVQNLALSKPRDSTESNDCSDTKAWAWCAAYPLLRDAVVNYQNLEDFILVLYSTQR